MPNVITTKLQVARLWLRVEQGAYLDKILPELRQATARDELGEFLLRGMLEYKLELLWALRQVYPRFSRFPPLMRALLLLSGFQLRHTATPAALVVNEAVQAVKELRLRRLAGAANSGLRRLAEVPEPQASAFDSHLEYFSVATSLPPWIMQELLQDYPEVDPQALATGYTASRRPWLRLDSNRLNREELVRAAAAEGLELEEAPWQDLYYRPLNRAPAEIPAVARNELIVHDVSAAAAITLLAPQTGDRVLDACAAPGGKLRQLLEHRLELEVIAVEKTPGRLRAMQRLLPPADGVTFIQKDLQELTEGTFDRILLDVPCSGSGNYGKKPDSRYHRGAEQLTELVELQRRLLDAAVDRLRPGGRLVYSTCSVFNRENERQLEWFLQRHSAFRLVTECSARLPQSAPGMVKYLPWVHQTGGAFAVALTRE